MSKPDQQMYKTFVLELTAGQSIKTVLANSTNALLNYQIPEGRTAKIHIMIEATETDSTGA